MEEEADELIKFYTERYVIPFGWGLRNPNLWIEFIKANQGRFHSLSELSREYHRRR
jgi:hypothetical protein